jgi:hypothetical protein
MIAVVTTDRQRSTNDSTDLSHPSAKLGIACKCLATLTTQQQNSDVTRAEFCPSADTDIEAINSCINQHIPTPKRYQHLQSCSKMPRLHPRMLHQARKLDPLLPLILQATRDLASAKNELRWLKEFVSSPPQQGQQHSKQDNHDLSHRRLHKLCYDRSRGKPLQYILSSEYFGDLEIPCAKGVLIPR